MSNVIRKANGIHASIEIRNTLFNGGGVIPSVPPWRDERYESTILFWFRGYLARVLVGESGVQQGV